MQELYDQIKQQNQKLSDTIRKTTENDSTNMKFTNYELDEIRNIRKINTILFIAFYCVAAVFLGILIAQPAMNIYIKGGIVVAIAIFPFVIYTLEYGVYYILSYLYSLLTFTPFNSIYLSKYRPKSYETLFNNRYYQL